MGIGFVVFIHLIGIFFLSTVIAIPACVTAYFLSKEKRKRKAILAMVSPFIGLYTLYFFALFGSVIVSENKKVDIGIGDSWYVPVSDNCLLLFIDIPEDAFIECSGRTIISAVSKLQQNGQVLYGETHEGDFFSYNTSNQKLQKFTCEGDLKSAADDNIELKNAIDFYSDRRFEVAGSSIVVVGIISLILSISSILIMWHLLLRLKKWQEPVVRKFMRRKFSNKILDI